MTAAALNLSAIESVAHLRLISAGPSGRTRAALRRDLFALVSHVLTANAWREEFDQLIDRQIEAGLIAEEKRGWVKATANAERAATRFLGAKPPAGLDWPRLRDELLVAKALAMAGSGIAAKSPERIANLDGLRAAALETGLGIDLRKANSAAAIRNVLAYRSLENAFGSALLQKLPRRPNLPGLIGRLIAAQLMKKPRHFENDTRLVGQLAAESIGANGVDIGALRLAVLRQFAVPAAAASAAAEATITAGKAPATATPAKPGTNSGNGHDHAPPPRLEDFAREVMRLAAPHATGWAGNRKAYISDVWSAVAASHPDWDLDAPGFKSLLLQAHKAGHLALTNADLRDGQNLERIRASALAFQNTEWHLIRVEDL